MIETTYQIRELECNESGSDFQLILTRNIGCKDIIEAMDETFHGYSCSEDGTGDGRGDVICDNDAQDGDDDAMEDVDGHTSKRVCFKEPCISQVPSVL